MLDVVLIAAAAVLLAALSTRRLGRRGEPRLVEAELPFIVSLQAPRSEGRLRDSAARRALEKVPEKARHAH